MLVAVTVFLTSQLDEVEPLTGSQSAHVDEVEEALTGSQSDQVDEPDALDFLEVVLLDLSQLAQTGSMDTLTGFSGMGMVTVFW